MHFIGVNTGGQKGGVAEEDSATNDVVSFKQDTLIIPVVSSGNVGQLAVDLFLSTGRAQAPPLVEKVGYLDTDLVAPAAGYEVFGPGQPPRLCVNLELHRFASKGVTFLQQRGPVFAGKEKQFSQELVRWARESGFKDILALTGADAAEGLDPTPLGRGGGMKRFRAGTVVGAHQGEALPPAPCTLEEALSSAGIGVLDLEQAMGTGWSSLMAPIGGTSFDRPDGGRAGDVLGAIDDAFRVNEGRGGESGLLSETTEGGQQYPPPLPTGTGISSYLCKEASASAAEPGIDASPPLLVLLHFCSEGDNTPHAVAMAEVVNSSLRLLPEGYGADGSRPGAVRWSSPLSWASLYGPPPDADAYR